MRVNFSSKTGQVVSFGYAGPSLEAPVSLTEGETATITLYGYVDAPTAARLNGTAITLTDAGSGDFTFPVPRVPDDTNAEIQVDVDGYTTIAASAYENLFPYANTEHGEPHEKSVLFGIQFDSTQPYEIRVASDTDPAIMSIDWAQIDADGAWLEDVSPYITLAGGLDSGTANATLEFYQHETGAVDSQVITIEDLGPNGIVTIDDIAESRNGAVISWSYDRADADGFEYSLDEGATWTVASSPAELTTLNSEQEYPFWVAAYNADARGIITKTAFTTLAGVDTKPNAFAFTPAVDVALSTDVTPNKVVSNAITIQGVDAATDVPVSVSGDTGSEYQVSTDNGGSYGAWTTTPTNVRLGYKIRVRHDASPEYSSGPYDGTRNTTLDAGTTTATFTSTTIADTEGPAILLQGGNITWTQGAPWVEPGVTATDNADGPIPDGDITKGAPDVNTLGPQPVNYSATDLSGNVGTATRTVTVVEATPTTGFLLSPQRIKLSLA